MNPMFEKQIAAWESVVAGMTPEQKFAAIAVGARAFGHCMAKEADKDKAHQLAMQMNRILDGVGLPTCIIALNTIMTLCLQQIPPGNARIVAVTGVGNLLNNLLGLNDQIDAEEATKQ